MTPPTTLDAALDAALETALALLPVAGRLLLLLLAAALLARAARRFLPGFGERIALDRRADQLGFGRLMARLQIERGATSLLTQLVVWGLWAGAIGLALESLGFAALSAGLARVIAFLPRALLGLGIVLGGVVLADQVERLFGRVAAGGEWAGSAALGRLLHYGIVVLGISLGAEQIGLEVSLLRGLIAIAIGGAALGIFGLLAIGLAPMMGRLMARYYLRRTLERGDTLQMAGCSGVLVQFGATGLVLKNDEGVQLIPYDVALTASFSRQRPTAQEEMQ